MPPVPSSPPPDAARFLAASSVFRGLDPTILGDLLPAMAWRSLRGGDLLFRQGDEADGLYLVVSGRLRVILEDGRGHPARVLREVSRGESVGEMALLTGERRTATVAAVRDTELALLARDAFNGLLTREPRAVVGVTRMLAGWLASSNEPWARSTVPATIALVSLGEGVSLPDFTPRLVAALERFGHTTHLNAARVDQQLGDGAAQAAEGSDDYLRATRWMNDQEAAVRFLVYEGDPGHSRWTARCLGQADRILHMAASAEPPAHNAVPSSRRQAWAAGGGVTEELVLLHKTSLPEGTRRWLELGEFAIHHHLRENDDADISRLARHLAGRAVGVVLGGGGARGFAHICVLRALEESKIPIDRLGGASMGAVIGAQYASGLSPAEMLDLNRRGWMSFKPHRRFTLPLISLLSGSAGDKMLEMMFGDRRIEDLWLNYFCVSTNLSRAELMVHRDGPASRWVRASASIPGSAPPLVTDSGDLLVDGGALDNIPVRAMREMGDGPIIAVDVSPAVDLVVDQNLKQAPSPWEVLFGRLRPEDRRRAFPSLFQILYRTALLSSIRAAKAGQEGNTISFKPPTSGFDIFDMKAMERIAEVGYRYAVERLSGLGQDWMIG